MFDWHIILGITAGLIALGAIIPYIEDILHGTTRPNVFSYALWAAILVISISAQVSSGASWSLILLVGDLLGVVAVVVLCLIGYGYKKYGKIEGVCTVLAVLAIISWQITEQPLAAIVFVIIADLLAAVPTIAKTYRDPRSEIPYTWLMVAFAALLGIASTTIFDLPNTLFHTSVFLINSTVGVLALHGRRSRKLSNK